MGLKLDYLIYNKTLTVKNICSTRLGCKDILRLKNHCLWQKLIFRSFFSYKYFMLSLNVFMRKELLGFRRTLLNELVKHTSLGIQLGLEFFYLKVNPLNLEFLNQDLRKFFSFTEFPNLNWSRNSWSLARTSKQTNRDVYTFIYTFLITLSCLETKFLP